MHKRRKLSQREEIFHIFHLINNKYNFIHRLTANISYFIYIKKQSFSRTFFSSLFPQIEKNRDILKSVGKRRGKNDIFDYDTKNLLLRTDPGESVKADGDINNEQQPRTFYDTPTIADNDNFNERRNLKYLYRRLNEKTFNGF